MRFFLTGSANSPISNDVLEDIVAAPGTTVSMPCNVKHTPDPFVVWKKNGNSIPIAGRINIDASGTLNIQAVRFSDSGTYECWLGGFYNRVTTTIKLNLASHESKLLKPSSHMS